MKLRILQERITTNRETNEGSRKYPRMVVHSDVEETERLQFSLDDGKTWQDVPVVTEEWEHNL